MSSRGIFFAEGGGAAWRDAGLNPGDAEAGGLEKRADFLRIVALEFDLSLADRAPATAGLAGLAGESLDVGGSDLRLEIIDNHDGLASTLGLLAPEDDAAVPTRRRGLFRHQRLGGTLGEAFELKARKGRLERALPTGGVDAGFHQGAKNGGRR